MKKNSPNWLPKDYPFDFWNHDYISAPKEMPSTNKSDYDEPSDFDDDDEEEDTDFPYYY